MYCPEMLVRFVLIGRALSANRAKLCQGGGAWDMREIEIASAI